MNNKNHNILKAVIFFILSFLCLTFLCVLLYVKRNFVFTNSNPVQQILFHMIVQVDGANPTFIRGIVLRCVFLPLFGALLATFILYGNLDLLKKIQNIKPIGIIKKYSLIISLVLMIVSFVMLASHLKLYDYIDAYRSTSTLYEDEYVDPRQVDFRFPQTKRNLIYIILESAETSDYSVSEGGAFKYNYIPELYQLAEDNVTFNHNKGFVEAPGAGWTVGAIVAQSAGIPLNIPIEENSFVTSNKYLPGAYTLGDLLNENGYTNEWLLGSESLFGGRTYYYQMHGDYIIHDYDWAVETGLIKEEDKVWWGYEDYRLFEYAKNDLLELAKKNEPFNLTMLTVDTHHLEGWVCKYCENKYDVQLGNVFACSSRQVDEFVEWIKQHDFYENTTIVITGDHCSMDPDFKDLMGEFDRRVYYTIINPADNENYNKDSDRILCTYDIYPTIVASLGIEFEENRLGLGTNLFSNTETLCEKYGTERFFHLARKHSNWYDTHILYGFE